VTTKSWLVNSGGGNGMEHTATAIPFLFVPLNTINCKVILAKIRITDCHSGCSALLAVVAHKL